MMAAVMEIALMIPRNVVTMESGLIAIMSVLQTRPVAKVNVAIPMIAVLTASA